LGFGFLYKIIEPEPVTVWFCYFLGKNRTEPKMITPKTYPAAGDQFMHPEFRKVVVTLKLQHYLIMFVILP
jgi:hypothetical protein